MIRRAVLPLAAAIAALALAAPFAGTPTASGWHGPFDAARLADQIPEPMRSAYLDAATSWDLDWALLAAIGRLECDHGRNRQPGCWPPGTINQAGARGPMQFLGSTWRTDAGRRDLDVSGPPAADGRGWATDGDGDGIADPWSAYDAVHAAARYLVHLGGRDNPRQAAKHYNAGPANPNPTVGEGYAARVIDLVAHYHTIAGTGGPGAPATVAIGDGSGCSLPDPTGTGGCVTPATARLVDQLQHAFPRLPVACWAPRPNNPTSDHPRGRACDITIGHIGRHPTTTERTHGWAAANWLVAAADRLTIAYIIWDGRIWSTRHGWQPYRSRIYNTATPTGGHYDHIHVSVTAGPE